MCLVVGPSVQSEAALRRATAAIGCAASTCVRTSSAAITLSGAAAANTAASRAASFLEHIHHLVGGFLSHVEHSWLGAVFAACQTSDNIFRRVFDSVGYLTYDILYTTCDLARLATGVGRGGGRWGCSGRRRCATCACTYCIGHGLDSSAERILAVASAATTGDSLDDVAHGPGSVLNKIADRTCTAAAAAATCDTFNYIANWTGHTAAQ